MKAQELIQPSVDELMEKRQIGHLSVALNILDPLVDKMIHASDPNQALMHLGSINWFIPPKKKIIDQIRNAGPSIAEEIVGVQPMDQHGPSGISPEEMRILRSTDIYLFKAASLLRHGIYSRHELSSAFDPFVLCKFIHDADVSPRSQEKILRTGISSWREGRSLEAAFILMPLVENAIVRCCAYLGGDVLALSRSESTSRRTGEAIVQLVEMAFGENWSFFVRHLWAREGAIRHSYCHGFITDVQVNEPAVDLAIYTLIALAYNLITKLVQDDKVRQLAHSLWDKRGRPIGDDWADWFEAERKLV
jgi:hypothetical protein